MTVKLLLDENISPRLAQAIGTVWCPKDVLEVDHVRAVYGPSIKDEDLLPRLTPDGFCLVSFDHQQRQKHASLLLEHRVLALYLPKRNGATRLDGLRDLLRRWDDLRDRIVPHFGAARAFQVKADRIQDVTHGLRSRIESLCR